MEFVAVDVETANHALESICQIGVVTFCDGATVDTWSSLLNPEDYFDPVNTSIHGISQSGVADAPVFTDILPDLESRLAGKVVVSHSWFDRVALLRASAKYNTDLPVCRWLDTVRVARRTWPDLGAGGYGLACLAQHLGLDLKHHDAESDAWAAGEVLLRAVEITGIGLEAWLDTMSGQTVSSSRYQNWRSLDVEREGNPEGFLYGEEVVFTGTLTLPRAAAADLAAERGCRVANAVTKATTILVVGQQDLRLLAGHSKSTKHRKAEAMIAAGHPIGILGEDDFLRLLNTIS